MDKLRKGFPILEQYTYLNTAASGLLPEKVWEFRQDHDLDFLISASLLKEKMGEILNATRERLGAFFGCAPNRVALVPNFSFGYNTLLEGLGKSLKTLLIRNDYPSVNWPVTSRNFEVSYAEIGENLEENISDAFKKKTPDLFVFSIVQYLNGIKIDLGFLNQLKQLYPDTLFVADGTQYFGTEIFNFEKSGIDVAISSGYKWLNAGYGNGFILFKDNLQEKIKPKNLGFGSLQGKYKAQDGSLIGKFEPGHLDTLNFGSLAEALDLQKAIGPELIEERIGTLKAKAKEAFAEMGLLGNAVVKRKNQSSIFNIQGDEKLFRKLRQRKIITSMRGEGIRVSFHYFNTEDELELLIKELRQ